ncbi:uncharacterized protein LOC119070320 [Bradysia coprophila]|uniref:uncharacterized protein LOC119070320 n=1 Tax=Bradysia coprophila TaxID=38358 RepID=UPI00187DA682|nr:uncharacterized protein LOC119070320 [Bradysia coprophila]
MNHNNAVVSVDLNEPDLTIYRKGLHSHTQCTFGCRTLGNLVSVPRATRMFLLMNYKFLILKTSQMCSDHIGLENYWPLVKQITREVAPEEQKLVSDLMFEYYQSSRSELVFNIDNLNSIDDEDFKSWFGFYKTEFTTICTYIRSSEAKHVAVLLCKMRTSLSNKQMSFLFGCCEQTIANHMTKARNDLLENLVPLFLNNNDRNIILNHNTPIAKSLFDMDDQNGVCLFDATYRFAQKSKNFVGQKQLWSEQKKMPLTKPMVGCAPDGYVFYVLGPYDATHNDAVILKDCLVRYEDTLAGLRKNDVIVVDNGFRDVLGDLSERGLLAYVPGTGQRDTFEANKARFVTKIRWVNEQVFGRLKQKFKLFAIPAHNSTLFHDYDSLRIAFALLNLFHKPILSDKEHEDIAILMKSRLNVPNLLKDVVDHYNLSRVKIPYIDLNYTSLDNRANNMLLRFPQLSMDDLYNVSLGPYQIKNAISYYAQHQQEDIFLVQKFEPSLRYRIASLDYAKFDIKISDPVLIKAYMKSRFRSTKHHHIFVLFDQSKSARDSIVEYFCTCETGSRTVGCCSHVMTIIWYLGYGQYNEIQVPNPNITNVSITIPKVRVNDEEGIEDSDTDD